MLHSAYGAACVVDARGRYQGVVRMETIVREMDAMQEAARRHAAELRAAEERS